MKINRKLKSGAKNQAKQLSGNHSGISMLHKFSTLEVIFLTMLPIDAAVWYVARDQVKTKTTPTQLVKKEPIPEVVLPVFKPEFPVVSEPVLKPIMEKAAAKIVPIPVKPEKSMEERVQAEIDQAMKEPEDTWSQDLVEWNRAANVIVKKSMDKYAMEPEHNMANSPRVGRMAYAWQETGYHPHLGSDSGTGGARSANDAMTTSSNVRSTSTILGSSTGRTAYAWQDHNSYRAHIGSIPARPVMNIQRSLASLTGKPSAACTLKPAATPDPLCRAKTCCRICGGTCCLCEAKLEGLLG